jgi:hypothetical protein
MKAQLLVQQSFSSGRLSPSNGNLQDWRRLHWALQHALRRRGEAPAVPRRSVGLYRDLDQNLMRIPCPTSLEIPRPSCGNDSSLAQSAGLCAGPRTCPAAST